MLKRTGSIFPPILHLPLPADPLQIIHPSFLVFSLFFCFFSPTLPSVSLVSSLISFPSSSFPTFRHTLFTSTPIPFSPVLSCLSHHFASFSTSVFPSFYSRVHLCPSVSFFPSLAYQHTRCLVLHLFLISNYECSLLFFLLSPLLFSFTVWSVSLCISWSRERLWL